MRNAFILHGIYGHPGENWFPWIKKELEKKEMKVAVPSLPTHEPLLPEHWWQAIAQDEKKINAETIIIASLYKKVL